MSTDLQVQQPKMIVVARGLIAERFEREDMAQARAVASEIENGLVIVTPSAAAEIEADLRVLREAKRSAKAFQGEVLMIPKAVEKAVREDMTVRMAEIERADETATMALESYHKRARAEAEAAARKAQQEADRRAAEDAARAKEAAAAGQEVEPAPPPVVVAPPVATGSKSAPLVSRLVVEMANHHDVDPAWITLNGGMARDYFGYQEKVQGSRFPVGRENAITMNGCKVWREESIAVRG